MNDIRLSRIVGARLSLAIDCQLVVNAKLAFGHSTEIRLHRHLAGNVRR